MAARIFAALLLTAAPAVAADPPQQKVKILLLATKYDHAWNTHMYPEGCKVLAACLNQTPGVEAVVCPDLDWPSDPKLLDGVKAIVFYSRPAGDILLSPARRKRVDGLLKAGVGLTAIHWATGTQQAKYGPDYLDLLGGWFHFDHSKLIQFATLRLEQVDPGHPVCRGWQPYPHHDEIYVNLKFHPDAKPVLKMRTDDKANPDQVVAWTLERAGGGRSFGTTLGHFHATFGYEGFRKAVVNGILWTARVDPPAAGAPAAVTAADLAVPPEPPKGK